MRRNIIKEKVLSAMHNCQNAVVTVTVSLDGGEGHPEYPPPQKQQQQNSVIARIKSTNIRCNYMYILYVCICISSVALSNPKMVSCADQEGRQGIRTPLENHNKATDSLRITGMDSVWSTSVRQRNAMAFRHRADDDPLCLLK